jgi:hypothetical protein
MVQLEPLSRAVDLEDEKIVGCHTVEKPTGVILSAERLA